MSFIYIVQMVDSSYYKIGRTGDFKKRLANMNTSCPKQIIEIKLFETDSKCVATIELTVHKILSKFNKKGEWFELTDKQLDQITIIIDEIILLYKPENTNIPKENPIITNTAGIINAYDPKVKHDIEYIIETDIIDDIDKENNIIDSDDKPFSEYKKQLIYRIVKKGNDFLIRENGIRPKYISSDHPDYYSVVSKFFYLQKKRKINGQHIVVKPNMISIYANK